MPTLAPVCNTKATIELQKHPYSSQWSIEFQLSNYHQHILVGNSTDFIELNVEPSMFPRSVALNSSFDFGIDIFVSADATDGDAATFTVCAESTSNSDINDFISFDLVVTTSPPPEFTENEVCM